jgi:hypothetical protein
LVTDAVSKAIEGSSLKDAAERLNKWQVSHGRSNKWQTSDNTLKHSDALKLANHLGFGDLPWSWDKPRTREGYAFCL